MSESKDDALVTYRPTSLRVRIKVLGIGVLGSQAINWAFDFILYPYVLWRFGLVYGCLITTTLSALACYLLLLFYD